VTQPPLKVAAAFRVVAYLILAAAGIQAMLDVASAATPFLPDLVAWRVKAEGLAAAAWSTPALVILLMCFLAYASEDRKVLLVLTGASALCAVLLAATSTLFALDAVEMSRSIPPADKKGYFIAAGYAIAKFGIAILSFGLLAWSSSKAARSLKRASAGASRQPVFVGVAGAPSN
jgi:hypothetical protein